MRAQRRILVMAAAGAVAALLPGHAAAWQDKFPELVMAIVPAENAQGTTERFTPMAEYLSKQLGTKVTLRVAADYAAVIEGHRAGSIHIGWHGPGSYARAYKVTNGGVEAFAAPINPDGTIGYYSVIYVKADSPYKTIADLKGKKLALVDPNSTSGNYAVRFFLNEQGFPVDTFFSDAIYAGSHENAVVALANGTVDAATNWYNDATSSNLMQMDKKGLAKAADFRIAWQSPLLAAAPWAYVTALPPEARAAIQKAFVEMPQLDKATFDKIHDGKSPGFAPVKHADYEAQIRINEFLDELRRKRS